MLLDKIKRNREIIFYGLIMALLMLLVQWLQIRFILFQYSFEIYALFIAVIFTALGIWLATKLTSPKVTTVIIEKTIHESVFSINHEEIRLRKISKRELDVLELMAQGLSNQEIADKLFVSLNTIKTHSSNLFDKLEVKRRTQAVETAKKLQIIRHTLG